MNIEEAIEQIADYYGLESQSRQCGEECAELIVTLSKLRRDDTGTACAIYDVAEEIADVYVMTMQMQYLLEIPDKQIEDIMKEKLKERLEEVASNNKESFKSAKEKKQISAMKKETAKESEETDKIVKVDLTESQAENLAEFIELEFIHSIRNDRELDNIEYICDICDVYRKLRGVNAKEGTKE